MKHLDDVKNLLSELVLLKQMAEGEDRGLIRDPMADQLDAGKAAHGARLDMGLFNGLGTEGILLLRQVNVEYCDET